MYSIKDEKDTFFGNLEFYADTYQHESFASFLNTAAKCWIK